MSRVADLQTRVGEWADEVFGSPSVRPSTPAIKHLATEVVELATVAALPSAREDFLEEYADCLMLLLDAARRDGLHADEVVEAAFRKLVANKNRRWEKSYQEHERETILVDAEALLRREQLRGNG